MLKAFVFLVYISYIDFMPKGVLREKDFHAFAIERHR